MNAIIRYTAELPENAEGFNACPECHGKRFHFGPRGGMAVNVECAGCGAAFNIGELAPGYFELLHRLEPHRLTTLQAGTERSH